MQWLYLLAIQKSRLVASRFGNRERLWPPEPDEGPGPWTEERAAAWRSWAEAGYGVRAEPPSLVARASMPVHAPGAGIAVTTGEAVS